MNNAISSRTIEQILEMARWAPSGDNTQPWRFEVLDDSHLVVHGFDTREHCVYDLDGHPSQISHGALLETISIAASSHGLRTECRRRIGLPDTTPTFDVQFVPDPGLQTDVLLASVPSRSVQRRALSAKMLGSAEKRTLEQAVGTDYRIIWLDGFAAKLKTAKLMFKNAHLRLTMREAYLVHKDVIEWNARFSTQRVPDQALGVDAATAKVMRFVMHSWERVQFFNRYLAGTWAPRIQMDFLPSLACGAHFVIVAKRPAASIDDYVAAGRALQRFWLTVTHLGLLMQPEMTPLIFSRYAREGLAFSAEAAKLEEARGLAAGFDDLIGADNARNSVYMGRVGAGKAAGSRSTRMPMTLLVKK